MSNETPKYTLDDFLQEIKSVTNRKALDKLEEILKEKHPLIHKELENYRLMVWRKNMRKYGFMFQNIDLENKQRKNNFKKT
jgi:hypothetical protein